MHFDTIAGRRHRTALTLFDETDLQAAVCHCDALFACVGLQKGFAGHAGCFASSLLL